MAKQPKAVPQLAQAETLNGSNTLPAMIEITATESVQLGEIVMAAHKASGLSIEAWNALAEGERDSLLTQTIERMKGKAELLAAVEAVGEMDGLQPMTEPTPMVIAEQVLIVSAPAGPRRRAGLGFSPVPVELRLEDLGADPEATLDALRADPMLKIDGRFEERRAEIDA